jgi:hypothetical protein
MHKTILLPEQKSVNKKPSIISNNSGITFAEQSSIELRSIPMTFGNDLPTSVSPENEFSQRMGTSRNTSTEKEKQKRVVTNTKRWRFTETDYTKENQLRLLKSIQHMEPGISTDPQVCVLQQLKQKVAGYKSQDILKDIYNPILFVTRERVIELLIASDLKCHYCKNDVNVLYEIVREPLQWTLDRIDNNYGHNIGNLFIACLSCNLRRRTIYHERYVITKICTNVIKLS